MGQEKSVPAHSVAGALSSSLATIVTQPFDVIKTSMIGNKQSKTVLNSLSTFKSILLGEGIKGLWKGSVPSFWRVLPGGFVYFGAINFTSTQIRDFTKKELTPMENFFIGASSRAIATTLLSPISLIKTRFEFYPSNVGIFQTLRQISKVEGLSGLFKGLMPSILRDSSYSGFFFVFYSATKTTLNNMFPEHEVKVQMVSGSFSGVMATVITHPFDVVRTRIQLSTGNDIYSGAWRTLNSLYRTEGGLKVLFRGVVPRCIKRSVQSTISWTLYEQIAKFLSK